MSSIKNYLSLIKFSHTIFAMPFAMIGFFLGVLKNKLHIQQWNLNTTVGWGSNNVSTYQIIIKFLLVLLCMITARSAAMAFNRYLDRSFDAANPRTAIREIPKGIIAVNGALIFTIVSSLLFVVCSYFINTLCFALSPIALFVVLFYSYTKRFTPLCHLVLGVGLSLAPIGSYLAVTGVFAPLPLLFSFAVIFWVSGFDIIYALQDEQFDKEHKLYSIPAWLGKKKALTVSRIFHAISALFILAAGLHGDFQWLYWLGFSVFAGMLIYQQSLVKPNDLSRVNLAFMTANGIASIAFGILVISDMLIR